MSTDNGSGKWESMSPLKKVGTGVGVLIASLIGCATMLVQSDNRALEALPPAERTATIEAREAKRTEKAEEEAPEATEETKPTDEPEATEIPATDEPSETPKPSNTPKPSKTNTPKTTASPMPTEVPATAIPPTAVPATAVPIPPTEPPPPPAPTEPPPVAPSGCVDINRAPREALVNIIHIGEERVDDLIRLRPFASVDSLVRIKGIAAGRLKDIKAQGLACVVP